MFEEMHHGFTCIENFIQLNEASEQSRVAPVGQFIEAMHLYGTKNMTFDDFTRFVNCCPNVKRLILRPTTFKDHLLV